MSSTVLDGKWLAKLYQLAIQREASELCLRHGRAPGLAVILVGDNPASHAYVKRKGKVAARCGFQTFDSQLAENATPNEIAEVIESYNARDDVDGILLQLPLPKASSAATNELIEKIDPTKDVDGLHPYNQGLLLRGEGYLRSCTPLGVMKLLDLACSGVKPGATECFPGDIPPCDLSGKHAVVIGRSVLVGKPVSFLLQERNATVTMAHSRTKNLAALCKQADILVAAVGRAHLVTAEWVRPESIVIDVGINRLESGKLTGDVDYESVASHVAAITPVPGGVGQLTVAMLMLNTLYSFKNQFGESL